MDQGWAHATPTVEGEGPSSEASSGGIGGMHFVMRHLSGTGRGHAQQVDNGWGWWPFARGVDTRSLAGRRRVDSWVPRRQGTSANGSRLGVIVPDIAPHLDPHMAAMVSMVREVLPHIPDEMVVQVSIFYWFVVHSLSVACKVNSNYLPAEVSPLSKWLT